ncbi:MAG: GNAT family N-acetyltransferase [Bacteroidaceae bacterium]
MNMIRYRKATIYDAPFVAVVVTEALGNSIMERMTAGNESSEDLRLLKQIEEVCRRTDTLYSWKNTNVAISSDGEPVGAIVAYPGEGYLECRARTFDLLGNLITFDVASMDAETRDGEYYLDSLAVHPRWRGRGIARQLIIQAQKEAAQMGRPAVLACAPDNTGARRLYEALGFRQEGRMYIFGENYLRMVSSSVTSS